MVTVKRAKPVAGLDETSGGMPVPEHEVPAGALEARAIQYGCLAPIEGKALVDEQLRAAARYYNDLIALERCARAVYRDLRREHVDLSAPEVRVADLSRQLDDLREQINAGRASRQPRQHINELIACARSTREQLREARVTLSIARREARENPGFRKAVAELEVRKKVWSRALRASTVAFWGTYLLVERSIEQAQKAQNDPAFRRARGRERVSREGEAAAEGNIGVQIKYGISVATLLKGEDTRLRLTDAPDSLRGRRVSARGLRRCANKLLHIRVGSDGRAPIWAVFPMILHRPLPDGSTIKAAIVSLRVAGYRERWTVTLTYTRPAASTAPRDGMVALDLGWRLRPDSSLRAGYWVDAAGNHGEVLFPARLREQLRTARALQSIQDVLFNRARKWLTRWLAVRSAPIPEWLEFERATLRQWTSHQRLRRLVFRWRDHRFTDDGHIYEALERWMHKSRHLTQYQRGAGRNASPLGKNDPALLSRNDPPADHVSTPSTPAERVWIDGTSSAVRTG